MHKILRFTYYLYNQAAPPQKSLPQVYIPRHHLTNSSISQQSLMLRLTSVTYSNHKQVTADHYILCVAISFVMILAQEL